MDEILVAFGALHMRDNLGADAETRSLILMSFMLGALVALLTMHVVVRVRSRRRM